MIFSNEKKYLFALNPLYRTLKYFAANTSVSTPQMILLKILEKNDIKLSNIVTIFKYIGFLDYTVLMIEDIWSRNLRNLNILREFFMAILSLCATAAP